MSASEAFGVPLPSLPDGWTPLEACVVVKALDGEGRLRLVSRYSEGLTSWEVLGMLTAEAATQQDDIVQSFRGDDD